MKVLLIGLYRSGGEEKKPIRLANVQDLTSFGIFTRGTISEHLHFASRTIVQRTKEGTRQTVGLQDNPFLVHTYVRVDGLSGVVIADKEYPQRVAFSLIQKVMADYEQTTKTKWQTVAEDQSDEPEQMKKDLAAFQDPAEADKLTKIQKNLDDIKEIMSKNIEEVLKRGETLDSLMDKSEDLSATSVQFYKQAKKTNQCCKYY